MTDSCRQIGLQVSVHITLLPCGKRSGKQVAHSCVQELLWCRCERQSCGRCSASEDAQDSHHPVSMGPVWLCPDRDQRWAAQEKQEAQSGADQEGNGEAAQKRPEGLKKTGTSTVFAVDAELLRLRALWKNTRFFDRVTVVLQQRCVRANQEGRWDLIRRTTVRARLRRQG